MTALTEAMGPLQGIDVLDFGHYYASPLVGMLLADQGANVIRIVRPAEQGATYHKELPEQQYRLLNRNKKLLPLDLKSSAGLEQARSLIAKADIVIENFRPGVMQRLGLDYASVKADNPRLIYLSLPGFASTDKARASIPAWEGVLDAAMGLYTEMHAHRKVLGYPPVYSWMPASSIYGALHGMTAILSALLARDERGVGTVIEVPLAEAGRSALAGLFTWDWKPGVDPVFRTADARDNPKTDPSVPEALASYAYAAEDSQKIQEQKLADVLREKYMFDPCNRFYRCADDRQIIVFCATNTALTERLLRALGLYIKLQQEGFVNVGAWEQNLDNDLSNFYNMSEPNRRRYLTLMKEIFLTKTAAQWEAQLGEIAPVAMIRTKAEFLALEPLLKSGVLARMDNGISTLTVPGRFVEIAGPAGQNPDIFREAELIDVEQAERVLVNNANTTPENALPALKKSDLLKTLKVLDLSDGVAGPASSYNLAQYGAQVIKLDNPFWPYPSGSHALDFGQGKRYLLANLKTAPGQDILKQLVAWADLVLHNNLDDVCEQLGVTQKDLLAINPNVVSCQLSSLGGSHRGGWELRSGWEPIPMSVTGIMAHYGTLESPQVHGYGVVGDFTGGLSLAIGGLLAVWQQRRTGFAGEARASLAKCCSYIQLPYMIAENGNSDWGEDHGQFALGDHYWQRLYACRDGWIFVGTQEARALELSEVITGNRNGDVAALEACFSRFDCAYWREKLGALDIGCHEVETIENAFRRAPLRKAPAEAEDARAQGAGEVLCVEHHPFGQPIMIKAADWVRVGEEHSYLRLAPTMTFGWHSREILRDLGYDEETVDRWIRLKFVHEYMPGMRGKGAYVFDPKIDNTR